MELHLGFRFLLVRAIVLIMIRFVSKEELIGFNKNEWFHTCVTLRLEKGTYVRIKPKSNFSF